MTIVIITYENLRLKQSQLVPLFNIIKYFGTSQVAPVVKNPPANAGDIRNKNLIAGLGRSPAGGLGQPLQDCCLENPMDRGTWWATVHSVAKRHD